MDINTIVIIIMLISALFALKLLTFWQKREMRQRLIDQRRRTIRQAYDQILSLQEDIFTRLHEERQQAKLYEDYRALDEIRRYEQQFDDIVRSFNAEDLSGYMFEPLMDRLNLLYQTCSEFLASLGKLSEHIVDRRQEHHGDWADAYYVPPKPVPLANSKFFRGCQTIEDLTTKYHTLAKLYHPDNGGDPKRFMEMRKDYRICKNTLEGAS